MTTPDEILVLASGGVDSAVLVANQAAQGHVVQPMYIRFGLAWEQVEEAHLRHFLGRLRGQGEVRPLVALELPISDVYETHWSVSGAGAPDATTPDEAVYLPGRNLLLLAKTAVWCALHAVGRVALGTLQGNPFADASAGFFSGFADLASFALSQPLEVVTPFSALTKAEVLSLGRGLPLEHTFSCIAPAATEHCGTCNKCAERHKAFAEAGIEDRTTYSRS
jgi:7-cyano-7-deazaguanine synthase